MLASWHARYPKPLKKSTYYSMKRNYAISLVAILALYSCLPVFADDLIALRSEQPVESKSTSPPPSELKTHQYQIDVYTKTDYKPALFEEAHFLGPEIAVKWNNFQQKYKVVHEQSVGLTGKTVEIRKPAVYNAVNKINNYLKKSLKKGEITKSEVIRIMDHVLTCSIELYSEPDTLAIEKDIAASKNIADILNIFESIKINYHIN